jgi:hypothetical protein
VLAVLVLSGWWSPASAGEMCALELVSDSPVTLEPTATGVGAEVLVATSCPTDGLRAHSDVEGLAITADPNPEPDDDAAAFEGASGRTIVRFTLAAPAPAPETEVEGHVAVASDRGALLVVPVGVADAKPPAVTILADPVADYRAGDDVALVHLSITTADAALPTAGLGATVFLADGGSVTATSVTAKAVAGPPTQGSAGTSSTTTSTVLASIAKGDAIELEVVFPAAPLTGGGGVLSLTRTVDGTTTSLATADLTITRQVSEQEGWIMVLAPLLLALLTIAAGAFVIFLDRRTTYTSLTTQIDALTKRIKANDPERQALEGQRKALRKERRERAAGALPKRAKWTFADGWAGSLTAFGAAVASVLAATGLLTEFLPGLSTGPFIAANLFFIALVASAPMAYNTFGRYVQGEQVGTFFGLYVSAFVSLWGVFGFLALLIALVSELEQSFVSAFFLVMLAVAALATVVYAFRTLRGRAQEPAQDGPAPTPFTVSLPMDQIIEAVADKLRSDGAAAEVVAGVNAARAAPEAAGPLELAVPDAQVQGIVEAEADRVTAAAAAAVTPLPATPAPLDAAAVAVIAAAMAAATPAPQEEPWGGF